MPVDLFVEMAAFIRTAPNNLAERFAWHMTGDRDLYDVAKRITLEAGMPWTDPRTLKTHEPHKIAARQKK